MSFSKNERKILKHLARKKNPVTSKDILPVLYGRTKPPKNAVRVASITLQRLTAKLLEKHADVQLVVEGTVGRR